MSATKLSQSSPGMPGLWDDPSLRRYLGALRDYTRTFQSVSCTSRGVRDDQDYVWPETMTPPGGNPGSILDALASYSRLAVTADSVGASLLCRMVARRLSSGSVAPVPDGLRDYLPVYIDLPDLDKSFFNPGVTLSDVITVLNDGIVEWDQSSFLSRLVLGSSLIILDNLDALSQSEHAAALRWIVEAESWKSLIMVPTRNPEQKALDSFAVVRVAEFGPPQQVKLASSRFPDHSAFLDFHGNLMGSPALQVMAADPIKLGMMVDVFKIDSKIPVSEFGLSQAFLVAVSRTVKESSPPKMGIPLYLQKDWMSAVGFHLQQRKANGQGEYASADEIEGWIQDVLGEESAAAARLNLSTTLANTLLFIKGRDGLRFATKSLQSACASQYVAKHVVSPTFILGRKNLSGVSRQALGEWSRDESWSDVMAGVKIILEQEHSLEWLNEYNEAIESQRPVADASNHKNSTHEGPQL